MLIMTLLPDLWKSMSIGSIVGDFLPIFRIFVNYFANLSAQIVFTRV